VFTGTTTLNAENGEEIRKSGSKFKRELSNMSEKQASQIQIAIWVIGGLCILIMAITGASVGYVINAQNKRIDALETWRQKHMEEFNIEAKVVSLEKELSKHEEWMKEHSQFSQDQVLKINNNLSRIAAKLNVDLK